MSLAVWRLLPFFFRKIWVWQVMFSQTELNLTFYFLYNSNSKHMAKINLTNTEGLPAVTICIKCDRRGEPFHVWIH